MKRGGLVLGISAGFNLILVGLFLRLSQKTVDVTVTPIISPAGRERARADAMAIPIRQEDLHENRSEAWRALHSDDLKVFATNLRAAGLSDPLIRAIISAEIDERYRVRELALKPPRPQLGYWQYDETKEPLETKVARLDLKREKTRLLLDVMGADPERQDNGRIPANKHQLAQMIAEDYDTLISEINPSRDRILLPSERQMLAQLEGEKHRELEELLTREELTEFIVRRSPAGQFLRQQLRGFQPTEAEFRAIFEAQNEFEGTMKAVRVDQMMRAGSDAYAAAQRRMESELKTTLGDERYQAYVRERDPELGMLRDLAARVGVSRQDAERVYDLRDFITRESARIGDDTSLSIEARQTALGELAGKTRNEIQTLLGPEAAAAYLRGADEWLNLVEQGNVVQLSPGGISSYSATAPRPSLAPPPP